MKSIFQFSDYKTYLESQLGGKRERRGLRAKLAAFVGCQTAHVSQVLNGGSQFTIEQAFKINGFLKHDEEESHFFLLLLQKSRAGTIEVQRYFSQQIQDILTHRSLIKNRLEKIKEIPTEHHARYYSSWHYLAIHVAISIPGLQTKEALSEHFRLPLVMVNEALHFLCSIGLAEQIGGRYHTGRLNIHLGNDSDNINKHHTNWRVQAMESLGRAVAEDIHYSVVFSLSVADSKKLRDRLLEVIKANLRDVGPSKEETMYCTCIDFFELKK